jgi:hypothetical protein
MESDLSCDKPDLRGGIKHKNTSRHFLEIDHYTYLKRLKKFIQELS